MTAKVLYKVTLVELEIRPDGSRSSRPLGQAEWVHASSARQAESLVRRRRREHHRGCIVRSDGVEVWIDAIAKEVPREY